MAALACSSCDLLELNILRGVRKASSVVFILAFDRANFVFFQGTGKWDAFGGSVVMPRVNHT